MIDSIHACVDLLHVGYHVKDEYDPIILNVYHCLKVEGKNDEKYSINMLYSGADDYLKLPCSRHVLDTVIYIHIRREHR